MLMSMKREFVRLITPLLPGASLILQDWRGQRQAALHSTARICISSPSAIDSYPLVPKPSCYNDRTSTNLELLWESLSQSYQISLLVPWKMTTVWMGTLWYFILCIISLDYLQDNWWLQLSQSEKIQIVSASGGKLKMSTKDPIWNKSHTQS